MQPRVASRARKGKAGPSKEDRLLAAANSEVVAAVLNVGAEPTVSGTDPVEPTDAALWVAEALQAHCGAQLTAAKLNRLKVEFTSPALGKKISVFGIKISSDSPDYVPMVEALVKKLRSTSFGKKALPAGCTVDDMEAVLSELLQHLREREQNGQGVPAQATSGNALGANSVPGAASAGSAGGGVPSGSAGPQINGGMSVAAFLAALSGQAPPATPVVATKFTVAEYNEAVKQLKHKFFYPVDITFVPYYAQIDGAAEQAEWL